MSYKKTAFYQVFTIIFGLLVLSISGALLVNVLYYLVLANFNFTSPLVDSLRPKGTFVEVDGHQMHLYCTGEGDNVAILEADKNNWSIYWDAIQNEVSKFSKVCSYDRVGRGWSDGEVQNYNDDLKTLHKLLATAGLPGPYILVGHAWGAENMLRYEHDYPEDVKAMIFYNYDRKKEEALMEAYKNDQLNVPLIMITQAINDLPTEEQAKQDDVRVRLNFHLSDWQENSAFVVLDNSDKAGAFQAVTKAIQSFNNL